MKTCVVVFFIFATAARAFVSPPSLVNARNFAALKMAATSQDLPVNLINPQFYWGEEKYKRFVSEYNTNALINRVYPVLDRVREKKLLTLTAELGLLSALEDAGLTLSQAEALLPLVEEAGLLSFVANNAEFLLNTAGFLAVEPADLALPLVVNTIKGGAGLFNNIAAAAVLAEVATIVVTKSPVIGVVAAVPLLGTAYAATLVAGLFGGLKISGDIKTKSVSKTSEPIKVSVSASKKSSSNVEKASGTRPKIQAVPEAKPSQYIKPKSKPSKKAAGNLSNLPKKRPSVKVA